jgi:hypothetical protein
MRYFSFRQEPVHVVKSIEVKNDLKIPHLYRDDTGYLQAKADLDQEIITYKTRGSACYKKAAKAGVACAIRARTGCFVQLTSAVATYIVRSLCTGNTKIRRDIWHVPIERRTLACIISLLDEQQINNKTFFSDYLETSHSDVITAFLDTYKESTHNQRTSAINTFLPTAENMRHTSSNALEYKSLVKEGTKYISRLVVSYTHGAQQIFNKVQKRRAEFQRLRSQMQAEKKATATAATGKAVVDLTEREDENGNHMNMKIMQIMDDRVNSRTANSVTIAAKKEARKVAMEQVDRRVKGILKQCGITAELPILPDGEPPSPSTSNSYPQPPAQAQPTSMITTQNTDETKNKRKRGSDRQRGSKNNSNRNGNKNYNRNASPHYNDNNNNNRNGNDDKQDSTNNNNTSSGTAYNDNSNYGITDNNDDNNNAANGDTDYSHHNDYDDSGGNNQAYEQNNNSNSYNNSNYNNNRNNDYNNTGSDRSNIRNSGNHTSRNGHNNMPTGNGNINNTGSNSPNRHNYTNNNNNPRNGHNKIPTNGQNGNNNNKNNPRCASGTYNDKRYHGNSPDPQRNNGNNNGDQRVCFGEDPGPNTIATNSHSNNTVNTNNNGGTNYNNNNNNKNNNGINTRGRGRRNGPEMAETQETTIRITRETRFNNSITHGASHATKPSAAIQDTN